MIEWKFGLERLRWFDSSLNCPPLDSDEDHIEEDDWRGCRNISRSWKKIIKAWLYFRRHGIMFLFTKELDSEEIIFTKNFFIFSCRSFGIKWIRWDKWLIYDVSYKQKRVALLCESKSVISGAHLCLVVGWCRMCNHLMRTPWWLKIQERMNVIIEEYMTRVKFFTFLHHWTFSSYILAS